MTLNTVAQNAPRMRRHKRRLNDDGSELSNHVRSFLDQHQQLQERQADNLNGIGAGTTGGSTDGRGAVAPAMGGGNAAGTDTTAATSTRGAVGGGGRVTSSPTLVSSSSSSRATPTSTSSSDFFDSVLSDLFGDPSSTTRSTTSTTSSSSTSTSTSTSTRTSSSTSSTPTTSSSYSSYTPVTATMVVTTVPSQTSSAAAASDTPKSTSSKAGPIIGIVAGALVGVVVLSGLVGFLFKKYNKKDDPYEDSPFDRDAFQRHSTMIPDHFDSDDGHMGGGMGAMTPPGVNEMTEANYHNFGAHPAGPHYESGISAGMAGMAGGAAAAAAMAAHNEGGPRPPTMFARHATAHQHHQQQQQGPQVGGYYKDGDYSNNMMANVPTSQSHQEYAPPMAAFAHQQGGSGFLEDPHMSQQHQRSVSPAPQLPPLAAFGGDPYSIAGVGRGAQPHSSPQQQNIVNPYAHLDRAQPGQFVPGQMVGANGGRNSGSLASSENDHGYSPADQRHASLSAAEALTAGLAHQSSLNRSVSPNHPTNSAATTGYDHSTSGRPGTAEGRSGTPDLPNIQQTYAVPGQDSKSGGNRASAQDLLSGSSNHTSPTSAGVVNPFDSPAPAYHEVSQQQQSHYYQQYQQQAPQDSNSLSVRNLTGASHQQQQQRPISTASSVPDEEDAYGGVY